MTEEWTIGRINNLSRLEMCRMWRFVEPGHPVFVRDTPLWKAFKERFDKLGGFSPEISKKIGFER